MQSGIEKKENNYCSRKKLKMQILNNRLKKNIHDGCERRHRCPYVHYYYRAKKADQEYRTTLSESGEGIPLNKAEFYENDRKRKTKVRPQVSTRQEIGTF